MAVDSSGTCGPKLARSDQKCKSAMKLTAVSCRKPTAVCRVGSRRRCVVSEADGGLVSEADRRSRVGSRPAVSCRKPTGGLVSEADRRSRVGSRRRSRVGSRPRTRPTAVSCQKPTAVSCRKPTAVSCRKPTAVSCRKPTAVSCEAVGRLRDATLGDTQDKSRTYKRIPPAGGASWCTNSSWSSWCTNSPRAAATKK